MTAVLLDTNALLWLVSRPEKIAPAAMETLADPSNSLYVSAASAWEIAIKTHLGRLDATELLTSWSEIVASMAVIETPIDATDAVTAGLLSWDHRDPFDRMIVAQASRRGWTIATSDRAVIDGTRTPVLDTRA